MRTPDNFLIHVLQKEYDTISAENAVIGIDFARNQHPDLILLDVMLPHLNGLDACQLLRNDEKNSKKFQSLFFLLVIEQATLPVDWI